MRGDYDMINLVTNPRGNIQLRKPITKHTIHDMIRHGIVDGTDAELNVDVENVSLEEIDNIASWVDEFANTIPLNLRVKDEYTIVIERGIK